MWENASEFPCVMSKHDNSLAKLFTVSNGNVSMYTYQLSIFVNILTMEIYSLKAIHTYHVE